MKKILSIGIVFLFSVSILAQQKPLSYENFDMAYRNEIKLENQQLSQRIQSFLPEVQTLNKETAQAIRNNDLKTALDLALKMEKVDPGNADIKNFKGKMLQASGAFSEAEKAFEEAIALNPKNKWFYVNKATAQADNNKMDEALQTVIKLNNLFPDWSIGYNCKASFLKASGKNEAAEKTYETALKAKPLSALIATNLGDLQLQMNHKDAAIKSYKRALEIQSDYPLAKDKLSAVLKNNP